MKIFVIGILFTCVLGLSVSLYRVESTLYAILNPTCTFGPVQAQPSSFTSPRT